MLDEHQELVPRTKKGDHFISLYVRKHLVFEVQSSNSILRILSATDT